MRPRKARVRKILDNRDFNALEKWAGETRSALRLLFSITYDDDVTIRYRAIEAIGVTAAFIAKYDLEQVRNFVRSLIWLMTEESGGIGWHAPESIAEVCIRVPVLADEYIRLLPQFLSEDSFVPSTCGALRRLASLSYDLNINQDTLRAAVSNSDEEFQKYDFSTGELTKITLKQLVKDLLEDL
jgi:hypothetical protein